MKSQDIQKVIDRTVGTRGTLRIPAWWMRKILSDLNKDLRDLTERVWRLENIITTVTEE